MSRFLLLEQDAIKAHGLLENLGYSELNMALVDMSSDNEPSRLIIDTEDCEFWFTDELALEQSKKLISDKFEQEIKSVTLKDLNKWKN